MYVYAEQKRQDRGNPRMNRCEGVVFCALSGKPISDRQHKQGRMNRTLHNPRIRPVCTRTPKMRSVRREFAHKSF